MMLRTTMQALLLLGLASGVVSHAQAQTAPVAAPVDPARLAAARELMRVMRTEEQTRKIIDASMGTMMHGMADRVLASMPNQPGVTDNPEFKAIMQRFMDRIGAQVTTQIKASMPQLLDGTTKIYARDFTVAQINDLTAFYRTPTGQLMVDKLPEITAQAGKLSQDLLLPGMMSGMKPALDQLQEDLKAWGAKHPEFGKGQ